MSKSVEHWNNIYETKGPSEVSWTEDYPSYSIGFIESLSLDKSLIKIIFNLFINFFLKFM